MFLWDNYLKLDLVVVNMYRYNSIIIHEVQLFKTNSIIY